MFIGIVAVTEVRGNQTKEQVANWLKGYSDLLYTDCVSVNFGGTPQNVHILHVDKRMPAMALNEMTSVDGWYFEVVNGKLVKLA